MIGVFRKSPLEKIPLSKLKEEEKSLELQANRTYKVIENLLQTKHSLFKEGIGQDRLKKHLLALKIQEVDVNARLKVSAFEALSQRRFFISNLIVLKECQKELMATPIWRKLQALSPEELERALVRVELREASLTDIVSRLNAVFESSAEPVCDSEKNQDPLFRIWDEVEAGNVSATEFDFDNELSKIKAEVSTV